MKNSLIFAVSCRSLTYGRKIQSLSISLTPSPEQWGTIGKAAAPFIINHQGQHWAFKPFESISAGFPQNSRPGNHRLTPYVKKEAGTCCVQPQWTLVHRTLDRFAGVLAENCSIIDYITEQKMEKQADIRLERKFTGDKVWFTSDTHFSHEGILTFCRRPFGSVAQMNEALINNWNEAVPDDGIVFHLGDFCHGGSAEWSDIVSRLHGKIYLILGNHDMKNIRRGFMDLFEAVLQQMTIRVDGQAIILNHNPFLCYGGSYRDVWQLFGHVHSGPLSSTGLDYPRLKALFPLQYDVGVDNNGYTPVSFAQVKARIDEQVRMSRQSLCLADAPSSRKIVFLDAKACFGGAEPDGPFPQGSIEALRSIVERTGALFVIVGPWAEHSLDLVTKIWVRASLPGEVYGVAGGEGDIKTRIGHWIASAGGGFRYVYIGEEPLDDFRALRISSERGIDRGDAEKAIGILG